MFAGEARRAIANIYLRCRKPNHPVLNHEEEMMKVMPQLTDAAVLLDVLIRLRGY